ncbi:TetR family transcriptional regulator C-terminal domain-containing protein [Streptomyces carpinensis]|uniref:TetR family transcriptional regulator C-terminal domain-containing protein n=2 Tax=Streptomyces carpinensis TaxID=66369 RepID=A0ABV1W3H7_9ACTN
MASSVQSKRVRKTPQARRTEIVSAAAAIALAEGLECITVRRVADELAVRPGLISHYFPVTEDLVAEAFGVAATAELDELIPADRPTGGPVEHLARFFSLTVGESYDGMSRLWLNARHLSRYRPTLADRVGRQEALWRDRLSGLIREGTEAGAFSTDDPVEAAVQILVVLDGLGAHANTDRGDRSPAVETMAVTTAERELHLPKGTLVALLTAPETQRAH